MNQIHGGDIEAYRRAYGKDPIDFSANINPLGMPMAARNAAQNALEAAVQYPDPDCTALCEAITAHDTVSAGQVLCGNGAADLIYRFAYATAPQAALVCAPTFGEYASALTASGAAVRTHHLRETDGFRVTERILPDLKGIDALFLCNPNNPTGLTVAPELLLTILDTCARQNTRVLLDECFLSLLDDPAHHTMVPRLRQYPQLVILKAFTKFYAMPGLRLGYALSADEALLGRMKSAGAPWSVSTVAQAAGIVTLADRQYIAETKAWIQTERAFLQQRLHQMGFAPMGEANFLLFQATPDLPAALAAEGILVRGCQSFEGLDGSWIRIAVRSREENLQLLSRLAACLRG